MNTFIQKCLSLFFIGFALTGFADVAQKISTSKEVITDASISDDGQSIVYYQANWRGVPSYLYISQMNTNGHFSTPSLVAEAGSPIANSRLRIKNFGGPIKDKTPPFTSFNGPMVAPDIVTFAAVASNGQYGIFYASKNGSHYIIHSIAWQSRNAKFDAPYIAGDSLYYLAEANTAEQFIIQYTIPTKNKTVLLDSKNNPEGINHFWNLSLYQNNIALRAEKNGVQGMYLVNTDSKQITRVVSTADLQSSSYPLTLGGPSIYDQSIAFVALSQQPNGSEMALFSNAVGHDFKTDLLATHQTFQGFNFSQIFNPTLMIQGNEAYMAFEGTPTDAIRSDASTFFVLEFDAKQSKLFSFVLPNTPAQKDAWEGRVVANIHLGPVSLRDMRIPIMVTYTDHRNSLYVVNLTPVVQSAAS